MERTGRRSAWTGDIAVEGAATRASHPGCSKQPGPATRDRGSLSLKMLDRRWHLALPVNQTIARNSCCLETADKQKMPVDERGKLSALLRTARLQSVRAQLSSSESLVNRKIVRVRYLWMQVPGPQHQPEKLASGPRGHARGKEAEMESCRTPTLATLEGVQRDLQGCSAPGLPATCCQWVWSRPFPAWR